MTFVIIAILSIFFCAKNGQVFGITGGEPAEEGEFPFMVSLNSVSENCHFCAGTIIGERWILTSSICYSRAWWGSISFGSNKLVSNSSGGYGPCSSFNSSIQRFVDDVLYNPHAFDRAPFTHDLVLVHLNESIPFGKNVQPVQLPEIDESWPYNETGTILGWGYEQPSPTFPNNDVLRTDLQKAQVPLYSDEYCTNSTIWDGWTLADVAVMKCGGQVNKTYYCSKDYGGPLLVKGKQYGIISYIHTGSGDGTCGSYLGIFSPVAYFRQWIQDTTGI